ncbi:MAG: ATP-binding cassette domain-containing protein [Piscinibacter sp.]|nr:ATP-binding cassette domain-containing protein [Piscinibacter sp.]
MSPVLHLEGLRYQRAGDGGFAIEVDRLALAPGQSVGIVGPSGCGKSTLIDIVALLRRPTRVARFELQGSDAAALWQRDDVDGCTALRAAQVGVVLQTGGLLPALTVIENVRLAPRLLGTLDDAWIDHLLGALDLRGLGPRRPAQLSIGQRQRVAIARALAHRPALLLADEPTASLGVDHAPAALDLLLALARDSGAALLIVSHDLPLLRAKGVPLRACAVQGDTVVLQEAA